MVLRDCICNSHLTILIGDLGQDTGRQREVEMDCVRVIHWAKVIVTKRHCPD